MTVDNMRIYEQVRAVPKEALKPFSNGRFTGTDINPMWRIKKLTELFGPCGIGWYTEITRQEVVPAGEGNLMVFVDLNLYVKDGGEWSKPIFGTGGNTLQAKGRGDDEGYKKAYTDAMSIACKALGIGADVWFANDTTSKYADKYIDDDGIPATGSAEAAQAVGQEKLKQYEERMQQPAEANSAQIKGTDMFKQMATQEQIDMLKALCNVDQVSAMTRMYGAGWQKMTANQAALLINKLKGGAA